MADFKLNYQLKTMEERAALVTEIVNSTPPSQPLSKRYLEILADYIMDAVPREEKLAHNILTENRLITINKRETSYEGLVEKFENGEDGVYNFITEANKNAILTPKIEITEKDIAEVPGLKELREAIDAVEEEAKFATGRRRYLLKKQIIEMRRDQYILKNSHYQPMAPTIAHGAPARIDLSERCWVDKNGEPQSSGLVSFFYPNHISAILRNYHALKAAVAEKYQSDFYYMMNDFDELMKKVLPQYPYYQDLVALKMAAVPSQEISARLEKKHGVAHSVQYISELWRNKIPKMLADQAKKDYLIYHYKEVEEGKWKTCSKCGQSKPVHPYFFTRNKCSKDGFYSICKDCRNKKS